MRVELGYVVTHAVHHVELCAATCGSCRYVSVTVKLFRMTHWNHSILVAVDQEYWASHVADFAEIVKSFFDKHLNQRTCDAMNCLFD